jgi:hypothetical protein
MAFLYKNIPRTIFGNTITNLIDVARILSGRATYSSVFGNLCNALPVSVTIVLNIAKIAAIKASARRSRRLVPTKHTFSI